MLGISWFELHQLQDTSDCITCVILLFCVQVTSEAVFIMLPLVSCRGISICAGATCDTLCARWHQVIHVTPCQSSHPHTCTILHASATYISKLVVQGVILQNQMHTLLTHQACGAAVHFEEHTYSRLLAVLIIVVFMVSVYVHCSAVLDDLGVEYFADFGTLLGMYREVRICEAAPYMQL